uniref:Ubiquitin-like domain-containing protein n=1 Tax=viral metagenome TaxID=1070528 RepID=A0A6C0DJV7_9ZZZZ
MKVTIRIFPINRRGSFTSIEVTISIVNPKVKDIFDFACSELKGKCKVAKGTTYLDMNEPLINGDCLNIIPI